MRACCVHFGAALTAGVASYIVSPSAPCAALCCAVCCALCCVDRANEHTLAYQSRVGPVEWLQPYTDDSIRCVCVWAGVEGALGSC